MKKLSRKLNLNRETIIPLTADVLDGINGGATITTVTTMTTDTSPSRWQIGSCAPTGSRLFCTTQTAAPQK